MQTSTYKESLQVLERFEEPYCDWYNIPFKDISKPVLDALLDLMHYGYYICGVTDGEGYYPKNFWEVETPMYCLKKLGNVYPLDNTKYEFYSFMKMEMSKNNKVSVDKFLSDSVVQNKLDKFLYEKGGNTYSIAMGIDKYDNFVFVEYKSDEEF